jgi:hypothetical protein
MKVQTFFYRLKELNDYIDWLPGGEPTLPDAQLNLAFYNSMPGLWRVCYAISGWSAHTTMCSELLHYFWVQEHKQATNKAKLAQKTQKQAQKESKRAAKREHGRCKHQLKGKQDGQGHKPGGPAKAKSSSSNCVSPTDKCPIHPDGNHMWGDCYLNIANKDKKIPSKGSTEKGKMSTTLTHEANLLVIEPATDHAPSGLVTTINKSELTGDELSAYMLDLFNKTLGRPSTHLADLQKAKAADDHKGTSSDSIQVLISLEEESVTHHLDEISLSAKQQEVNCKVLNSEFLTVFTHYIDELYSTGDSDVKLGLSNEVQTSRL